MTDNETFTYTVGTHDWALAKRRQGARLKRWDGESFYPADPTELTVPEACYGWFLFAEPTREDVQQVFMNTVRALEQAQSPSDIQDALKQANTVLAGWGLK